MPAPGKSPAGTAERLGFCPGHRDAGHSSHRKPKTSTLSLLLIRITRKKFSKWVDASGCGHLASRAATTEGGRETGSRSRCCCEATPPGRLFSPLERKFFDSVAQHEPCRKLVGNPVTRDPVDGKLRNKRWSVGKRAKRLNCAPRGDKPRGPEDGKPSGGLDSEVNLVRSHRKVVTTS